MIIIQTYWYLEDHIVLNYFKKSHMLLKYQTISHLDRASSFILQQDKVCCKQKDSFPISGKLQKQMCVPSMALFDTNSIFYCYAMHCFANYSKLSSEEKKIRILCVCGIHIYLFDTHKFICLTLKSIFFFCQEKQLSIVIY